MVQIKRKTRSTPEKDDFLYIDRNILDRETELQPKKMAKYSRDLAEAKQDVLEAKAKLELIAAELDPKIRRNPDKYGVETVTEPQVAKAIVRNKEYQKAQTELFELQREEADLKAIVNTLDHRKQAISDMVKLHLAGYWS